jgi:hypothetical protein
MQHFEHLSVDDRAGLFFRAPEHFSRSADVATLSVALGATLYMPATRPTIARDLVRQRAKGAMSSVICVEDAISDEDVQAGEANAVAQLTEFSDTNADDAAPLVFIRVRHPEQIASIAGRLGDAVRILSGFVLPKFTDISGAAYLDALEDTSRSLGHRLLGMPVIESPRSSTASRARTALVGIQRLLAKHRPSVLAVRTGATGPVRCVRHPARPGPDDLGRSCRRRRHRRRGEHPRPRRRHGARGDGSGVGVLLEPRAHLQAAAAPVAVRRA